MAPILKDAKEGLWIEKPKIFGSVFLTSQVLLDLAPCFL
jgi:hypothetical protein